MMTQTKKLNMPNLVYREAFDAVSELASGPVVGSLTGK